jgi:hypothetical protein
LKVNGTHQLLVYADYVNNLCESVPTVNKNTNTLLVASKEIGLEVMLINLSTWSCLKIRTQDEVTEWRLIIVPLNGWKGSNIWEQH